MRDPFHDKVVLITGGTGSFGRAMTTALLRRQPREIRIFSRDELKQETMRIELNDRRLRFLIGDVRSPDSVGSAMRGAHFVFHAAALKQVPSCDFFPIEAVQTNVLGSHNVIQAAIAHGIEKLVCLSTDKAVYPVNAMGMTKALMEKTAQAAARNSLDTGTRVCLVRYGNVLYSRGSVLPLFVEQIRTSRPLTITEPGMTRFLLPISQAIDLVLFAFAEGNSGDVFIRKAPACTIGDLAEAVRRLLDPRAPIQVIGIRHGEKIYETLATREELARADDMGDYFRVPMDGRDLNYARYFTEGDVREATLDDYTSHNTQRLDVEAVRGLLENLPEFQAALDRRRAGA